MLCKGCGSICRDDVEEKAMACPFCEQSGCDKCNHTGQVEIPGCPNQYVGPQLTQAITFATHASNGLLPVSGGLLDQAAWFIDMWTTLENDQNRIQADAMEQAARRR